MRIDGDEYRAATTTLPPPGDLRLVLFSPRESTGFFSSSPLVVAALAVFFAIALLFVLALLRMLGGQVRAMLDAARGIGEGDFSRKVPVVGGDEMAGLATEFNKMSDRLDAQMKELRSQQVEIDRSVRRIDRLLRRGAGLPSAGPVRQRFDVRPLGRTQPERVGEGVQHRVRREHAALFHATQVVGAHAREEADLLSPEARYTPRRAIRDAHLVRLDGITPGAQERAELRLGSHG